jgi:hypothetical protein
MITWRARVYTLRDTLCCRLPDQSGKSGTRRSPGEIFVRGNALCPPTRLPGLRNRTQAVDGSANVADRRAVDISDHHARY